MRTTSNFSPPTPRKTSANCLTTALADCCNAHLLREKWLLVPSYRVGQQWSDSVARIGQAVVNLHLKTLPAFALELAASSLVQDGLQPLSTVARHVLAARSLEQLRHRPNSYLGSLTPTLTLIQQVAATLRDLRLAGIGVKDLERGDFEVARKSRELAALLSEYEKTLREQRVADDADILIRAAAAGSSREVLVLIPEGWELAALERRLLEEIPRDHRIDLPVDPPLDRPPDEVFRAVGEINEVREVLRRCLANAWPLDQVEILSTDPDVYDGLIYETASALYRDAAVTFADGIAVRYTRPGRALTAWLNWRSNGFPQSALVAMVQDGLLILPDGLQATRVAGVLRAVPIGLGRERYLSKWDEFITGLTRQIAEAEQEHRPILQRCLETAQAWRPTMSLLLETADNPLLKSAADFLRHHVHCTNEADNTARQVLLDRLEELTSLLGGDTATSLDESEWLQWLLRTARVLGLGPRPGCLYVANIWSGGHSGRPHTFILGLDSRRFPPASFQDPVLLDAERRSLSAELATSAQRTDFVMGQFERLLARLRGRITFSYSCRDITQNADTFASAAITRQESEPPVSAFAPRSEEHCLDQAEWWLWRFCTGTPKVRQPMELLGLCYPRLGRGFRATQQRESEAFGAYDGFVPDAGPDLDPAISQDRLFSPRRLETLATCPLRYFYQYGLGLELPEELVIDPHRWLQPSDFGQLLHEVFHRSLRDGADLQQVLRERIEHYREKFPPPNEGVLRRDIRRLERACRIFLAEDNELQKTGRPIDFEKQISGVPVQLADGTTIHLRGRIDRVDESRGQLVLWDYKTGSTFRFRGTNKDPFLQGRLLQHALYIAIAETYFSRPVAQFGYFFPTEKGRGERILFTPSQLTALPGLLARLRQLIQRGAFPATNKVADCEFCDYRIVCADTDAVTTQSTVKLATPANSVLTPFRELRDQ